MKGSSLIEAKNQEVRQTLAYLVGRVAVRLVDLLVAMGGIGGRSSTSENAVGNSVANNRASSGRSLLRS
jgi:hypothetical protein